MNDETMTWKSLNPNKIWKTISASQIPKIKHLTSIKYSMLNYVTKRRMIETKGICLKYKQSHVHAINKHHWASTLFQILLRNKYKLYKKNLLTLISYWVANVNITAHFSIKRFQHYMLVNNIKITSHVQS